MQDNPWWRGAVIYQIYPRSLMDTNGDGVGDLRGIIQKLDYIASLGIDAIWVSPFFRSPMKDFGYDISDYRDVDPLFGNLADFDELIEKAHSLGIKVIIDQVLSHTSDQHAWFKASRSARDDAKADWYVWADASEDGTPPNNWLSIFGGSAWQWEPRRGQYYLHNFLQSQPDLNFHNLEVQQQILDEVEYWLQRGVDGLRLDAINFCFHDKELRNNPVKPIAERKARGFNEDNPYAFQRHIYDNTRPENLVFLTRLRQLLNRYPGSVSLGEISSEDSLATMAEYTQGKNRLHMAYSFELLGDDFSAKYIRSTIETLENNLQQGWPCWAIGNHDVARVVSRWQKSNYSQAAAKLLNALLLSLRGSVCVYQGEELGLPEAKLEYHQLQDPYGKAFWPAFKGRDGCRTPMPWTEGGHAGFSTCESWLPIPDEHKALNVSAQSASDASCLNAFRTFVAWRKTQACLRYGDIEFIESHEELLVFKRNFEGQSLLAAFNLAPNENCLPIDASMKLGVLTGHGFSTSVADNVIHLPAFSAFFANIVD